jgi:hypothetical protein
MSRKKQRENHPVEPDQTTSTHIEATEPLSQQEATTPSGPPDEPLFEEVQAFLSQRAELAQKLADEIAATEKKLAELKKTSAMLFPESVAVIPSKERKPKKPKLKSAAREHKPETTPGEGESSVAPPQ